VKCGVQRGLGTTFCNHCGNSTSKGAAVCLNCGVALSAFLDDGLKSKTIARLLGVFLGVLGIHNFYLGYTKKAVIQLILGLSVVLSTVSIIWGLIKGIYILMGKVTMDANGDPLKD
jgi:hypothetical protein